MAEEDEKLTPQLDQSPLPMPVETPVRERRRRPRARVISTDQAEALAAWDKSAAFGADDDDAEGAGAEPPAPDSVDLVLDVSDEIALSSASVGGAAGQAASGGFAGELPREPLTATIDAEALGFRPVASDFHPHAIAQTVATVAPATTRDLPAEGAPDAAAVRAQWQLLLDELAQLNRIGAGPRDVAALATAAARAAEAVDGGDAPALYQQALAVDPTFIPAQRGLFRLAWRAGQPHDAQAGAVALAAALPSDAEAYGAFISELRSSAASPLSAPAVEIAPPPLMQLVEDVRQVLRSSDRAAVVAPCVRLADQLGGEAGAALRGFATTVEQLHGQSAGVAAADAAAADAGSASPLALLRAALTLPPGEAGRAIDKLVAAAEGLPSSPLTPALWRLAARLARGCGDRPRAQSLLERARATGAQLLPAQEGIDLASDDLVAGQLPARPQLLDRLASVPGDTVALVAGRLAPSLASAGRTADALSIIDLAWQRDPDSGAALGTVLSRIIAQLEAAAAERSLLEQANALLGTIDPGRRTEVALTALLNATRDPDRRSAALEQLCNQWLDKPAAAPDPALAWWLAWQLRGSDRPAAIRALAAAADGWAQLGLPLAQAIQARGAALEAAADPKSFAATLPVTRFAESTTDDPAELVRQMVQPGLDARAIAGRFRSAAAAGSALRLHEATGWSVQAGAFAEARADLQAAPQEVRATPTGRRLLRRLARTAEEGKGAALLLRELGASADEPRSQALYEQLAAEALERAGQRGEAAAVYRELLAGPLAKDADLALRRTLFALRDGAALLDFWRDEFDACSGAGRDRAAAAAAVEKARVALDLFEDRELAAGEVAAALQLDPTSLPARVLGLCHVRGLGGSEQRQKQFERLVQEMPGQAAAVGFLAALIADGEGDGEAALRLLQAAVVDVKGPVPLALMRRYVAVLERREADEPDFVGLLAGAAERLVQTAGTDPRLTATVFLRAAEAATQAGDLGRAELLTERARALGPDDLPALVRLGRLQSERGEFRTAMRHLEAQAAVLRDPGRKAATLFTAALIAVDRLGEIDRARPLLIRVLELDPQHDGAFARLRSVLEAAGDNVSLAALLGRRALLVASGGTGEAVALRLERASLLAGKLADRAGAKKELTEVLAVEPENLTALGALSQLELDDGNAKVAGELALRQAALEQDPQRLVECHLRLGRLYRGGNGDPVAAVAAYEKVLGADANNREALEALSDLYASHGEARRGILVTERLLEPETDPVRRRPLLLRLGLLWESTGDVRRAGVCLRHAADASPRDLQTIGELVHFHDRQKDVAARNLLLDGTIALLRDDFRAGRDPLLALRGLIPVMQWRGRPAGALAAAQLLERLSTSQTEKAEAAAIALLAAKQRPIVSLARLRDDERALPAEVPPGLPHVLRTLGPALARTSKPDVRRFSVGRADRQGRSSPLRSELDPLAAEVGVKDFDAYITPTLANALAVEPGDPPALIIGTGIARMDPRAIRFAGAYCLRLAETHFAFLLRDGPIEAAALVAGLVRQFLPEHRPPYLPEAALKAADARMSKAMSRPLRTELAPLATQLAAGCSPEELFTAAQEVGARAGLLACGDVTVALDVLAAFAGRGDAALATLLELPLVKHLIDFALSDEHDALVAELG